MPITGWANNKTYSRCPKSILWGKTLPEGGNKIYSSLGVITVNVKGYETCMYHS